MLEELADPIEHRIEWIAHEAVAPVHAGRIADRIVGWRGDQAARLASGARLYAACAEPEADHLATSRIDRAARARIGHPIDGPPEWRIRDRGIGDGGGLGAGLIADVLERLAVGCDGEADAGALTALVIEQHGPVAALGCAGGVNTPLLPDAVGAQRGRGAARPAAPAVAAA